MISKNMGSNANRGFRLLDYLYDQPIISVRMAENHLKTSYVTADKAVQQLVRLKILSLTGRQKRNRLYSYAPYIELFESSVSGHAEGAPTQTTQR